MRTRLISGLKTLIVIFAFIAIAAFFLSNQQSTKTAQKRTIEKKSTIALLSFTK
jgi:CHASE3 domain sensor protein